MSWDNAGSGGGAWESGDARVHASTSPEYGNEYSGGDNTYGGEESGGANFGGGEGGGDDRPCFNCGETGHMKAECPNEAVQREFTGTCRLCEMEGHRASDCPSAPPRLCNNCGQEGHAVAECENARKIDRSHIQDVPAEQAWEEVVAAVADHDMEDAKDAIDKYVKAIPDVTYSQLEQAFRKLEVGIYLIAIEKELAPTYTNMDLQGNLKKTNTVTFRFSPKPQRPKESEGWPETPEQNAERLLDAGIPVDCKLPKCSNCEELGHIKRECPQEVNESTDRAEVKCYNCDEVGHRVRDCPKERPDKFACRNCKASGHSSKECPEPRSAEGVECKKCNEIGHFSKDCPTAPQVPCFNCGQLGHRKNDCTNEKQLICRNCDEIGHVSKECKKPRDYSRVTCLNCQQKGHTKVRCTNPTVSTDDDGKGNDTGYGESANTGYGDDTANADDYGTGEVATTGGGDNWASGGGGGGAGGW